MQESQIDTSTSERQLLYDIRTESRKANELLLQLLEVLRPVARDTEQEEVAPKIEARHIATSKVAKKKPAITKEKPKRGIRNVKNI